MKEKTHIIIIGCPRSGTSILGELFEVLPEYEYHFECPIDKLHKIQWNKKLQAIKNPRFTQNLFSGKQNYLPDLIPKDTRYLFITRHPLDNVCSLRPGMLKKRHILPMPWPKWEKKSLVEQCAALWAQSNASMNTFYGERDGVDCFWITYEDFVKYPMQTIKYVMEFLRYNRIPSNVVTFVNKIQDKTENSYHAKIQTKWFTNNHKTRLKRWGGELTKEEVEIVKKLTKDVNESLFGYSYE